MKSVLRELIETLWNVNQVKLDIDFENGMGINRNIVECKLAQVYFDFDLDDAN